MANEYDVDRVGIDIEVDTKNSSEKIDEVDKKLEKLQQTLSKGWDFSNIEKISNVFDSISGNIQAKSEKIKTSTANVEKAVEKMSDMKLPKLEWQDTVSDKFEKTADGMKKISASAEESAEKIKEIDTAIKPITKSTDKLSANFDKVGKNAKKSLSGVSKHSNKSYKSLTGVHKLLRRISDSIQFFLIYRVLSSVFQTITKSIQEGTTNLYQYSKALGGNLSENLDKLSTSFLYLKNAIGAAVAPIINYFTPIIEQVVDKLAEFANRLGEIFAKLTGQKTFQKAIKSQKEYAKAANDTAKANRNALASFDEINNITLSSSAKKTDELDYGSMFTTEKVNVNGWIDDLIKNIKAGRWNEVGSTLGNKLNEQFQNLNKKGIGANLGDKVNGIIDFGLGFVTTFDWAGATQTLLNQLMDFIKKVDWNKLGKLFLESVIAVVDVSNEVVDFISDPDNLIAITDAIYDLFNNPKEWKELGIKLVKLISKLLNPVTWINVSAGIAGLQLKLLGFDSSEVDDAMKTFMDDVKYNASALWRWLKDLFSFDPSKDLALKNYLGMPNTKKNAPRFKADGGFVGSGQMFIAREAGPEMVGSIGGRTAVANNDQIVQAVSLGVYNGVVDAMSKTSGSGQQPITVQINGREVFKAVQDESYSFKQRTGQPAF